MARRTLVFAVLLVVLVGGAWVAWYLTRPAAAPPAPTVATTAPAPVAPPRVETPPPAPRAPAAAPPARAREAPPPAAPVEAPPAEAAPTVGTLHIDSDIAGAQVFIDRTFIGVTPITAPDVAPGPHRLNIVAPGYESIAENVDVTAGPRDLQFNFKEVRLDAAIDVVHKHRIGSCKGRLTATPRGLRYETTNKDDAFTVALTDLELLEVDYLAKELRVKAKKGKRYEFTDPAANADRLFVFHRDVDKARTRLISETR